MLARKIFGKPNTDVFVICALRFLHRAGGSTLKGVGHYSLYAPSLRIERFGGSQAIVNNVEGDGEPMTIPESWICGLYREKQPSS